MRKEEEFLFQPACVVVDSVPEWISWSTVSPAYDPQLSDTAKILRLTDGDGVPITSYRWTENPVRRGNEWVFLNADGGTIQVRQATPGDAVSTGFAQYSLPMKLLREKSRNPAMAGQQEQLMAAVNPEDNYVLTLVMVSPVGVFARYSQNWFEIASANSLGNCYLVGIDDTAIETYDAYDARGAQVSVKQLPTIRDWVPQAGVAEVQLAEEVVATEGEMPGNPEGAALAAAGSLVLPTRADQEQAIARAIEIGQANEEVRWAIQRRLSQLHWEGELPWN